MFKVCKICKICKVNKNKDEFTKDPRNKDGFGSKCKICFNNRQRELYPKRKIKRPLNSEQYEYHRKWNKEWIRTFNGWVSILFRGCKTRKYCTIVKQDIIDLWNKQNGLCAMTGEKMDFTALSRAFNRPSLDRVDNSRGYHIDNIRLVLHFVNQSKNIFSDEQFISLCEKVVNFNKKEYII